MECQTERVECFRAFRTRFMIKIGMGSHIPRYDITGQGQYKIMHLRGLCSAVDQDDLVAIPDVLCDGGVEEIRALRYHRDVITEVVDLDTAVC